MTRTDSLKRYMLVLCLAWNPLVWNLPTQAATSESKSSTQIIIKYKQATSLPSTLGASSQQSARSVLPPGLRKIKSFILKGSKPRASKQSSGGVNASSNDLEIAVLRMNDPNGDRAAFIKQLMASGEVEYAEPDSLMHATALPDDPDFNVMWGLNNTGQSGGTAGVDIGVAEAWDSFTTGSESIVVGIVDTGIQYNHPDLIGNIWQNPGETGLDVDSRDKASNGIDDDRNGYIDDVHGIDCINNDGDPLDDNFSDYHGTHVAGTIGAQGNNANQVTGVNWEVRLMALKYLGANGNGTTSDAVECLTYVANMKADKGINIRVTNNSYGGSDFSQAMYDAIQATQNQDILFVAAAGNDNEDNDSLPHYPSSYNLPSIVSVASIQRNADKAGTSNYGLESVDIGAPGDSILSTSGASGVDTLSGTSMASPHVAGVAALLAAHDATLSWPQIKGRMMDTAVSASSLQGRTVTGGYVNAFDALNCSLVEGETQLYFEPNSSSEYVRIGQVLDFDVGLSNCGEPVLSETVTLSFDNGEASLNLLDDGVAPDATADDGRYLGAWSPNIAGAVTITITAGSLTTTLNRVVVDVSSYDIDPAHPYSWVESSDGTDIGLGNVDDAGALVPIGFDFEFYGISHNSLYAHSNGMLKFGGDVELSFFEFLELPSSNVPNNFISVLWEDLNPSVNSGRIFSKLEGTAPNRRLIIQWHNLLHFKQESDNLPGTVTFQAVLYEGSNDIVLQYNDLTFGSPIYDFAARALIGIEAFDGAEGISFLNQGQPAATVLTEQQALRFSINGSSQRTLLVEKPNNGSIVGDLSQINCGELNSSCFGQYSINADVTLTAIPATGYRFDAWTGAGCDSLSVNTCTVSMDAHKTIAAQFSFIPAVLVSPQTGLVVTEAGAEATFEISLNRVPSADVTINLSSSDISEATLSPTTLVFTPANQLAAKTVTVKGVNDDIDDGNVAFTIVTAAAQSLDTDFDGINPSDVLLSNSDDADMAGFIVVVDGTLDTSEELAAESFTLRLNSEPVDPVIVNLSSSDLSEGDLDKSSLTFGSLNWDQPQAVVLTGADDSIDDGDQNYQVDLSVDPSSDGTYSSLSIPSIAAQNADDDLGSVIVSTGQTTTTEAGGQIIFTVALASQPQFPVNIALFSSDTSEGGVSPAALSFDSSEWSSAKTVTVSGVNDDFDDGDVSYSIIIAAAVSDDTDYAGVNAQDIALLNQDDDTAAIIVSGDNLVTDEAGSTAQFSVSLATVPSHNVEIEVLSSDISEASVSANQIIFTPSDALMAKTITVTGLNDDEVDGDISYTISLQGAVSGDILYAGLDPRDVSAINTDLDLDFDKDGQVDDVDNCPGDKNAAQVNSDFADDGGDVCDDDDDNDGLLDGDDNCPLDHNPAQKDTDGDSEGDSCDPDSDNDSIYNVNDNCVFVANPSQEDSDGDGVGDACTSSVIIDDDLCVPIKTANDKVVLLCL